MWHNLSDVEKNEYKKMILAFASLTEMFAQKADTDENEILLSPIINSKYQETVFQKAFHAFAEDIGNTSYDVSIKNTKSDGTETKYLVGIKTFGIGSGLQKVAQFKANHDKWSSIISKMQNNAIDDNQNLKSKEEINQINTPLYLSLARQIATLRNMRIDSSKANIQGFSISDKEENLHSIYHVLMPSMKGEKPAIHVGETSYDKIDIDNIEIIGCTKSSKPTNFDFSDGNHTYRYTSADSQLLMNFNNREIVQETWDVIYADNAYDIFSKLAEQVYSNSTPKIVESYSWMITNKNNELERFSGFNSFYGVGSKSSKSQRIQTLKKIRENFEQDVKKELFEKVISELREYLLVRAETTEEKSRKIDQRNRIEACVFKSNNQEFAEAVIQKLYRPYNEMYIPIPNSQRFHEEHPNFFGKNIGTFKIDENGNPTKKLALSAEQREFNLIFEPSGDSLRAFITQDSGKAIESAEKQSYLGEWILRGVFQLSNHEPLTVQKLNEVGINGIRLYKLENSDDIHLKFIWIDSNNLPEDYIK